MKEEPYLEASRFLVNERPFCVWEWDLRKQNMEFISDLNPSYFGAMAKKLAAEWNDPVEHEVALSARMLYGHALETFIALVGATVQAPDCIAGWLLKYRWEDLEQIADKITRGRSLPNKLGIEPLKWVRFG